MVPFLGMLERYGLSLRDAEVDGRDEMALAVRRCQRCSEKTTCVHWLEWRGHDGDTPNCMNAVYFASLKMRARRR